MSDGPERMYVTTDAVAFSVGATGTLRVLLIQRAGEPYRGRWALPGGFVGLGEDLVDACARELAEETGLTPAAMAQIGAWGAPGRDPRGRNVSVAFLAVVPPGGTRADAGDDAAEAAWFGVDDLPELAFDHADILSAGLRKLRLLALSTHAVFGLLPDRFSLADLRRTLAAVRGAPVTVQQTAALAGCARLAVESEEEGRATYRCTVEELTTPLSQ